MTAASELSYDVRVWAARKVSRGKTAAYEVRWRVGSRRRSRTLRTSALAESFRSELITAMRRGEGFRLDTGLPPSMTPVQTGITWWAWAEEYAAVKWPQLAPGSRRGVAEALTTVTMALADGRPTGLAESRLRSAMMRYAFNVSARGEEPPASMVEPLKWLATHSPPMRNLNDLSVARSVLGAISINLDGKQAAPSTISRKRAIFYNSLEPAVEAGHLDANPLTRIKWKAPKVNDAIDMRVVVNHEQAQRLINAVGEQGEPGRRLVAFFACIYYAGLRPAEATDLRASDAQLP